MIAFPIEILIHISEYLSAIDIITLRKVSKFWRVLWGDERIIFQLIKSHHRIYFETHGAVLQDSFEESVLQQDAIQRSRYSSMAIFTYGDLGYDSEMSLERKYHGGRVAWCSEAAVFIFDLRTGITKRYTNSENEPVSKFWLHQDILVIQTDE